MIYLPDTEEEKKEEKDSDDSDEDDELTAEEKLRKEELEMEVIRPNDRLITGSADTSVKIWNLQTGECLHVRIF